MFIPQDLISLIKKDIGTGNSGKLCVNIKGTVSFTVGITRVFSRLF